MPIVHVTVFPSVSDFHEERRRLKNSNYQYHITSVGTNMGSTDTIWVASPLSTDNIHPYNEMMEMIVHEFTHNVIEVFNPQLIVKWLQEAVVVYESNQFVLERFKRIYNRLEEPMKISNLKDGEVYSMGYVLIDFIQTNWSEEKLFDLIKNNGDINENFDISVSDFDIEWQKFIVDKYL